MTTSRSRILDLLNLLQGSGPRSARDLARRLGVSTRTLRRDVDQLRELGYPVRGDRGVDGGYDLEPGVAMPPLALSVDEAFAVVLGLRAAAVSNIGGTRRSALSALGKIMKVLPARERRKATALDDALRFSDAASGTSFVNVEVLAALTISRAENRVLSVRYRTHHGAESIREIELHDLVLRNGNWYAVCFDCSANEWRALRADRMSDTELLKRAITPRATPYTDPEDYVEQAIVDTIGRHDVVVHVSADADYVRQFFGGWAQVSVADEYHSRVSIRAGSLEWAAGEIIALDAPFTVEQPRELAMILAARAQRVIESVTVH